jgi:hypothetical protein
MEFDFLVVPSWSPVDVERTGRWADELSARGHDVCFLRPTDRAGYRTSDGVHTVTLDDLERETTRTLTPDEVESTFCVPSLAHLAFTERLYFNLSHEAALDRGCRLAAAFADFFGRHSVDYAVQIRGAELHRLLVHYLVEHDGGTPVWAGFSPFEGTFSLQTDLQGSWDTYETVPYADIPESERTAVREHVEAFTSEKKRYTYGPPGADDDGSLPSRLAGAVKTLWDFGRRDAPGRRLAQVRAELRYWLQERINERLLPEFDESCRRIDSTEYVFFPLQYPVESRLTVFSPQFYHQEHLVGVLVVMPHELATEFRQLELVVVHFGNDARRPVLGEARELFSQIDHTR